VTSTKGALTVLLCLLLTAAVWPVVAGCDRGSQQQQAIQPLPATAEILFTSTRDTSTSRKEIYAMDAQGGDVTRITFTNENHFVVGIDGSNRYVVATRGTENKKRLWLLDLQTGEETPLTDAENHAEGRSFSPDGEWIVFWMIRSGETQADIYKIRRDGSEVTNLTNSPAAIEFDPAWSWDGTRIAFVCNTGSPNRFVLKTMSADGDDVKTVYDPANAIATERFPAGVYDPSWSPDGSAILVDQPVKFTGEGENGTAGVWHTLRIRVDGSEVVDLSEAGGHGDGAEYLPSFSADGESILLTIRYGPENPAQVSLDIFKMDDEGGDLEQLTASSAWDEFAVWIG
jgi:dipeptidyl aminopeptidase/acylaminoacyl peptidase